MLVLSACGADRTGPSVPTFADPAAAAEVAGGGSTEDDGAVPDDCTRLIAAADLNALLGLPLDSVAVRTTQHVGSPSVGRTERVACDYTGQGSVKGRLLQLDVSAYTDAEAATAQWRVNSDAEDGDRTEMSIGSASAVLVQRRSDAVLRVVYGIHNLAFVLPARKLPVERTAGEALVDLALRVLAAVDGGAGVVAPPSTAQAKVPDAP
ncbi:hypothetical protein [Pseudonocardia humida]|uniref:DUF3558 domain-containing protein n=1 Tax=Pseudonocardia humida TaxID=2800819 RepID=A0ABT1A4S4_9PSEU|nr:hypothetical protein [Pseudonocardia humida]MCO1657784.1 hypothetical protein [Pseudonocardia humida]